MQRKMIRWATRLLTKKKGKGKLREREREKDPNRFAKKKTSPNFGLCTHAKN